MDEAAGGPRHFANRYEIRQTLKSSNGVDTFLAVDRLTAADVVVKSIDPHVIHAAARLRFEHETHVLRTLEASGLTGLHDAGVAQDRLFLVQPYVPGETLESLLTHGPLSLTSALRVGVEVATALDAAHSAGVCHRDVKPANVIVSGHDHHGRIGNVTLIDFGFARSPWLDESIRDDLVGTVRYLAPEAAGLLAVPADERSDLYALGVLLYECLCGHAPFPGPSVGDLLRQHLSMAVPELRDTGLVVPRALDAILQRLLRKEPAERYQSAGALASDLASLLSAVSSGDTDPRLVIGRLDQRKSLTDPAFVGRDAELASLLALVSSVAGGGSGMVLLEADSGGGKSRLLTEIALHASSSGLTVLRGQGVAQAAQRPFTLLHGVAQDLITDAADGGQAQLLERVGESMPAVVRALPSLATLLHVSAEEDTGPEQFGEQRSLIALHHLLSTIATPERPVLIVLDDCQWADTLTVRLLTEAVAADLPPHLGVIAAFRSEEVPVDHPLRQISGAQSVQLGPLPPTAMSQLAESMAGPLPDKAVATVVRLADGSPFMGAAVLRGLVECGALVGAAAGWVVDEAALRDVQTARRSAAFLVRRLELLSSAALQVLSVGAVLGKEFDILTAVELAGESDAAATILEEARSRRLLWVDERSGRCSFFHDKIREALLERLGPSARQVLHGQAADALLRQGSTDARVFELAYHLDAAGRHAEAMPHALRAAEIARSQHGLESAVAHYRMAERGLPEDDRTTRTTVAEGLGDILTLQGVYREAEAQLSAAHALVTDTLHAAALDGKLGDLAFKQGDVPTARLHLEGAMTRLGRPLPTSSVILLLRLVWELLVQLTHTALPRLTTGRRSPEGREADFLAMRLYSRLAYLYWFHSGKVPCAWSHLRGLNLAERYPPSSELGQAYSEHAPVMTMIPWFRRALRYAQRSLEIRRDLGDVWGQGQSLGFAGVTLYAASRFAEGEEACRESLRLLEQTGDRWESNTAGWNLAMCLHRKGELQESAEVARGVYTAARAIGDQTSAGVGLSVWTRARCGRVDVALITDELASGSEDASTTTELQLALGLNALSRDDLDSAVSHLLDATATIKRAGLRQEYVAPVAAWAATAHRLRAESTPSHNPQLRARRMRQTARAVRRARFWSFSYRNNLPHALREAGLLASLRGRRRRAVKHLERSLAIALEQGAKYEAALTRLALAEAAAAWGSPGHDLVAARAAVRALDRPDVAPEHEDVTLPTMSLFDRFTTLLSVGRTITAAPSIAAVDGAIRDAALALLRGERCHLVNVTQVWDEELVSESGESVDSVSRTLLRRALEAGVPVVASDPTADESESLLLSGIRSVLAAPVLVHGEARSLFYVTHRQIGQLFGEEEVQLAAFIATMAGAAFEHLAGTETRFRSLAQNSSDVLTLVDRHGVVSYQSSAASRVFDLPGPGMVGRPIREWVHADDLAAFSEALDRAAVSQETRIECRFQHADGSYRFAETAVTNLLEDPTVAALVLNTRDVTDRRHLEDELRERALHDSLTGLPNRAMFLETAQRALDADDGRPMVTCFLDLDDFKAVNDSLGHGAGDDLLCTIADRLSACVRPQDTVARFGGDEFAVLLEDTSVSEALRVVERIREATALPVNLGDAQVVIHTSIGLAATTTKDTTPDQLLAEADAAMYAAKGRGSHCYDVFEPAMRVATEMRSRARTEIEHALVRDEFRVHYQPILDISSGAHIGVEALVRWQHPERGLLTPAAFIDHAEESGQITSIGQWVLTTACRDTASLAGGSHMSVNVSARQLQQPDLVDVVADVLATSGLSPDRLVLEITETATVADIEGAILRLEELKGLGLQLALDDFGTGYSPLSYLRRFPVDYLKIDRSFVRGVAKSEEDKAIVRGVIDMAHALGLRAVAEGVEEVEQQEVLRALGCDLGQGYLWMRPVPLDSLPVAAVPGPRAGA
ncbi:MAG: Sensory box histidine kinase [Frankiales bacterium]|nr:Sensory box histidine kinase [Frankiales bacterium]